MIITLKLVKSRSLLIALLSLLGFSLGAQNVYRGSGVSSLENQVESFHQRGGDSGEYLELLYNLGIAYSESGEFFQAQDTLMKALQVKVARSGRQDSTYTNMLSEYASALMETGSFDRAKQSLQEALQLNRQIYGEISPPVVFALNNLANLFEQVGMNSRSLDLFQTALSISRQIYPADDPHVAECLANVGGAFFKNGDLEMAMRFVSSALEIYQKEPNYNQNIEYIETVEKEGMIYEVMGRLDKAEKILLRTYELKQQIPGIKPSYILETLNDLGILYRDLQNYEKSAEYFEIAKNRAASYLGTDHYYYGTLANNLAGLKHLTHDYEEALALYQEASRIFLNYFGEYNTNYATSLNNIAGIYRLMKDFDRSKELYLKVIEIDKAILGEEHPDYAKVVNNLGILYSSMGKPKLAESLYLKSLELRGKYLGENHPSYAKSLENLGLYYFNQGDHPKSEEYFREALTLRQRQIGSIFPALTEKQRIQFYQDTREDIERYYSLALELHHEGSIASYIYDVQLSTKAIIYYASNKMRNAIFSSRDRQLIAVYNQWKAMNSRLVRYYQLGQTVLNDLNIDIKAFENKVDSLEKSLAYRSSTFDKGINQYKEVTWREVKAQLNPGEAAIEIIRLREFSQETEIDEATSYGFTQKINYVAVLLRHDAEPKIIKLNAGNAMENEYFNLYRNSIQYNLKSDHSYKYYWEQIDEHLSGIQTVYLSPDGVYNKINPNIIYNPASGKYIIDEKDIHYVTSTKDIVQVGLKNYATTTSTNKMAELFGNANFSTVDLDNVEALLNMPPLPGTEREVTALGSMFQSNGWQTSIHKELDASEQAVKRINNPKILHIATHGFFLKDKSIIGDSNPLLKSGLLLSNDVRLNSSDIMDSDDGVLTAYEAMNLNLEDTDLVVLSACETGLGEVQNGEGIFGLQRSFLVAGTNHLILSLFKVEDEATNQLMRLFYKNYLESGQIFSSFKKAQIELRESYDSPLTWGSFIVVGV